MPTRIQAVPGTNTIYATFQATIPKFCAGLNILWRYWWSWYERSLTSRSAGWGFSFQDGRWPAKSGFYNDPAAPSCLMKEQDLNGGGAYLWEPWNYGEGGCQSSKFIIGQCKNSSEVPLGGAIVQGFRTSDDLYIGEATTDDQGRYELRCPNTGSDQHYLVAYYDSSPDLGGTTVNTLIPTYRDGTT